MTQETGSPNQHYIHRITRFQCGCAYRTPIDTAVFCPTHRAFVTGKENIGLPDSRQPTIQGLVTHPEIPQIAIVLENTSRNSLHSRTTVMDGDQNDWADPQDEELGLCAACLVEEDDCVPTRIAMCECGNQKCSYRWCGRTAGLHAFWGLHAQGISEQVTGIPEGNIFSCGPCWEIKQETQNLLEEQRKHLLRQGEQLLEQFIQAREKVQPGAEPQEDSTETVFLIPWLDQEYQDMTPNPQQDPAVQESGKIRERQWAREGLIQKLTRLLVIGVTPGTPCRMPEDSSSSETEPTPVHPDQASML